MSISLKAGARVKSAVCDTQVMVIKAPAGDYELQCGGQPMVTPDATPADASLDGNFASGTLMGKRYVNGDESIELLCTKGGEGSMVLNGEPLEIKQAKQLPSSD